jgi:hypothetical protein
LFWIFYYSGIDTGIIQEIPDRCVFWSSKNIVVSLVKCASVHHNRLEPVVG